MCAYATRYAITIPYSYSHAGCVVYVPSNSQSNANANFQRWGPQAPSPKFLAHPASSASGKPSASAWLVAGGKALGELIEPEANPQSAVELL
jgi:hypothetical protein